MPVHAHPSTYACMHVCTCARIHADCRPTVKDTVDSSTNVTEIQRAKVLCPTATKAWSGRLPRTTPFRFLHMHAGICIHTRVCVRAFVVSMSSRGQARARQDSRQAIAHYCALQTRPLRLLLILVCVWCLWPACLSPLSLALFCSVPRWRVLLCNRPCPIPAISLFAHSRGPGMSCTARFRV